MTNADDILNNRDDPKDFNLHAFTWGVGGGGGVNTKYMKGHHRQVIEKLKVLEFCLL